MLQYKATDSATPTSMMRLNSPVVIGKANPTTTLAKRAATVLIAENIATRAPMDSSEASMVKRLSMGKEIPKQTAIANISMRKSIDSKGKK